MGSWWTFITLQELRALTDKEITDRANALIKPANAEGAGIRQPSDFLAAQFYLNELDRREKERADRKRDDRETRRHRVGMTVEILVALFIVCEIGLSWRDGHDEMAVLADFQRAANATVSVLTDLEANESNTTGPNPANAAVIISVKYDRNLHVLMVTNLGASEIVPTGYQFGSGRGIETKIDFPHAIPSGLSGGMIPTESVTYGTGFDPKSDKTYYTPFRLWFRKTDGTEYLALTPLSLKAADGSYDISCGRSSITTFQKKH